MLITALNDQDEYMNMPTPRIYIYEKGIGTGAHLKRAGKQRTFTNQDIEARRPIEAASVPKD